MGDPLLEHLPLVRAKGQRQRHAGDQHDQPGPQPDQETGEPDTGQQGQGQPQADDQELAQPGAGQLFVREPQGLGDLGRVVFAFIVYTIDIV